MSRVMEYTVHQTPETWRWYAVLREEHGAEYFETDQHFNVNDALWELREWAEKAGIAIRPKAQRSQSQLP